MILFAKTPLPRSLGALVFMYGALLLDFGVQACKGFGDAQGVVGGNANPET